MLQNAPRCACLPRPRSINSAGPGPVGRGGDECSDFKNPIGRTFLSGIRIFAETACPPVGRESLGYPCLHAGVQPACPKPRLQELRGGPGFGEGERFGTQA